MSQRTWFITGVSSGFGRELTAQLLARGDRVVGTVRDPGKVADLREQYPVTFRAEVLDMTDTAAIREVVERAFAQFGRIEVIISNAGYGLFGAAEEFTDEQIEHIVATNLVGTFRRPSGWLGAANQEDEGGEEITARAHAPTMPLSKAAQKRLSKDKAPLRSGRGPHSGGSWPAWPACHRA